MKLSIKTFADAGVLEKERLVLRALEDVDIGDYLVLRTKRSNKGGATGGGVDAYWLPDLEVKAGDLVVIYTRKGTSSKKELTGGRTAHFYYWKKDKTFWDAKDGNYAVLMETGAWRGESPEEVNLTDE
ncbi:hypothetical protein [Luteibacter jiangsuensis]